jgi:hypothetical protein
MLSLILGALEVGDWYSQTSVVGFTILSIVGVIALILVAAAILTPPVKSKLVGVFFLILVLIVVGAVVLTYLLSLIFALVVP